MLHLMVGKWKTPNHSNCKADDDSHKVKKKILKRIGRKNFSKKVGDNPDIDITVEGVIILKGRGKFKNRPYFVSDISADDYFVLKFVPFTESNEVEISILVPDKEEENNDTGFEFEFISDKLYIIPNDERLILITINYLIDKYINNNTKQEENFLVVLQSNNLKNED